jgi:hypothetical protein
MLLTTNTALALEKCIDKATGFSWVGADISKISFNQETIFVSAPTIAVTPSPAAHIKTIRARQTSFWGVFRSATQPSSRARQRDQAAGYISPSAAPKGALSNLPAG